MEENFTYKQLWCKWQQNSTNSDSINISDSRQEQTCLQNFATVSTNTGKNIIIIL